MDLAVLQHVGSSQTRDPTRVPCTGRWILYIEPSGKPQLSLSAKCILKNPLILYWRRKWQPTPVLLPGKSHERRSLVQATVHGVAKNRAQLSDFTFTFNLQLEAKTKTIVPAVVFITGNEMMLTAQ